MTLHYYIFQLIIAVVTDLKLTKSELSEKLTEHFANDLISLVESIMSDMFSVALCSHIPV